MAKKLVGKRPDRRATSGNREALAKAVNKIGGKGLKKRSGRDRRAKTGIRAELRQAINKREAVDLRRKRAKANLKFKLASKKKK